VVFVALWLLFPDKAPPGHTSTALVVVFFGSINMLAVSIIGEYIAKIFEEVKQRPHFVRRHMIRDGEIRNATEAGQTSFLQR
jgi:polyisoprenyl-phosphate glycosyltransferase